MVILITKILVIDDGVHIHYRIIVAIVPNSIYIVELRSQKRRLNLLIHVIVIFSWNDLVILAYSMTILLLLLIILPALRFLVSILLLTIIVIFFFLAEVLLLRRVLFVTLIFVRIITVIVRIGLFIIAIVFSSPLFPFSIIIFLLRSLYTFRVSFELLRFCIWTCWYFLELSPNTVMMLQIKIYINRSDGGGTFDVAHSINKFEFNPFLSHLIHSFLQLSFNIFL